MIGMNEMMLSLKAPPVNTVTMCHHGVATKKIMYAI